MNWTLFHLSFRLMSYVFVIVILGIFSLPFFFVLLIVNYAVLLKNDQLAAQWASTISSLAVSFFLPVWISRSPEKFQIMNDFELDRELKGSIEETCERMGAKSWCRTKEEEFNLEEKEKTEALCKKMVSFRMSLAATPILILFDTIAFLTIKYSGFIQSSVWTNNQLEEFYLIVLLPLFFLTMVASFGFSHHFERQSEQDRRAKWLKKPKKVLSVFCLICFVASASTFGAIGEKLNRTTLIVVNNENELVAVPIVSKGLLKNCHYFSTIGECTELIFNTSNFRTAHLQPNVAYLDASPKALKQLIDMSKLNAPNTPYFNLQDIHLWTKDAPEKILLENPHCKMCLVPSIICSQTLDSIQDIDRCSGK